MIAQPWSEPAVDHHRVEPLDQQRALRLAALSGAFGRHDRRQLGILVSRRFTVVPQHGAQHQRIRQAMRQVMNAAQWIGERMDSGDRTVYLAAVVDGRLERADSPLTNHRFFEIAPPDKRVIMNQQYEHDARLDADAIQQWRDERSAT